MKIVAILLLFLVACTVHANAQTEVDRNINIIFPPDLMQQMIDATTPELISNLKFTSSADKSNTEDATSKFHKQFLQTFNKLVTTSIRENFTPAEIAEWAAYQSTALGQKTMTWMRAKYPDILNKSMDAPMKDLFKNLGGQ